MSAEVWAEGRIDFSGQSVLVTGAFGRIGGGIADRFAKLGATVFRHARTARTGAVHAELSDAAAVDAMLQATGQIDVLINNAGSYPLSAFAEMDLDEYRKVRADNLDAVFVTSQRVAAQMIAGQHGGAIVNITSIEAHAPGALHAHYTSSKAAVEMLTRSMALELGPHQIRVNAVAPGLITYPELPSLWPEGVARYQKTAPLGRLGKPQDVADACAFLASPAASFVTGSTLVVDGGVLATPSF